MWRMQEVSVWLIAFLDRWSVTGIGST
jgi:hypothetical protein